ncbi:N-acetylmuramoyl-L-alanine amidase [Leuconostoc carnosum]|uniref:peptidoglycan recognition protein family protein n=1 Tax=Leuconostoc TaxID=1243 RepID=UPI001239B99A|nr:N-acetylmuramoyl-L-alanine amidase [Leuconostoc carnosum]KAA8371091.1 N-acetylmuramoyl-L-alanine amidase [Leuconostoc carnosum]KAA8382732.1 N-acetylmuramoyl-L-alanine amidase [Leuconostoc carnosum]
MGYEIEKKLVVPGRPAMANGLALRPFGQVHLHSTANTNATLDNEVAYLKNNWPNGYYTHLVGGGGRIIQVAETNGGAYDVGGDWNWETYAAIEFSENIKDQADFNKSYAAYIWLARKLADECGANYVLDDHDIVGIKTHNFASQTGHGSDHVDPIAFLAKWGVSYDKLKRDLLHGIDNIPSAKFKNGDQVVLAKNAYASTYNTKFTDYEKKTWGTVQSVKRYDKSKSRWSYEVKIGSKVWNVLEQDLLTRSKQQAQKSGGFKVGQWVTLKSSAYKWQTGQVIKDFAKNKKYQIKQVKSVNQSNSVQAVLLDGVNSWALAQDVQ